MTPSFKIDEDLPRQLAVILRNRGFDATTVPEEGMSGRTDEEVWQVVQGERRILVTADVEIADSRIHPVGTNAGIILLRPKFESRSAYIDLLDMLLKQLDPMHLMHRTTVVSPQKIRARGPASQ